MNEENFDILLEFVMKNIYFSYSSLTTFENCKYCYKLSYIEKKERVNNFFAEYGLLTHDTIEQYFNGSLESYELSSYFQQNYDRAIVTPPPPFPAGMEGKYIQQGEDFFDAFYFDKKAYDIVFVEDELNFKIEGFPIIGRPDLVLKEKSTEKNILLDYKTSVPFRHNKYTGKDTPDKPKIDGYFKQMYIYTYGIKEIYGLNIDEILIWFTRANREIMRPWEKEEEEKAIAWAGDIIGQIKVEKDFLYNNSSSYFCSFLCGVRDSCEYKANAMT